MKFTKKELLEEFIQSDAAVDEVYQWNSNVKRYTQDGPHGDFVKILGDINDSLLNDEHKYEVDFWTMDEAEYNNSIMAPFSPKCNFDVEFDDSKAKVFVVVVDHLEEYLNDNR